MKPLEINEGSRSAFWVAFKAFALSKSDKQQECLDLMLEIKPLKQTDPVIVKFLVLIFTGYGMNSECTKMLEGAQAVHQQRIDINEQLYFAYVRENLLLRQQN